MPEFHTCLCWLSLRSRSVLSTKRFVRRLNVGLRSLLCLNTAISGHTVVTVAGRFTRSKDERLSRFLDRRRHRLTHLRMLALTTLTVSYYRHCLMVVTSHLRSFVGNRRLITLLGLSNALSSALDRSSVSTTIVCSAMDRRAVSNALRVARATITNLYSGKGRVLQGLRSVLTRLITRSVSTRFRVQLLRLHRRSAERANSRSI